MATLHAAADAGVTFFDTADVYGDGRSERLVGRLLRERSGTGSPSRRRWAGALDQTVENYSPEHFRAWNDRSRENLGVETLDLVQLHCPPTDLYYHPEVFEDLDAMVARGPDRRLRRQRRARRGGAEGDRVPGRRDRADHLQPVPPAAGGRVLRGGRAPRRRRHRARPARVRPAVGQVHARDDLRRRRPPQLQPRRARRSTSARRSPACRSRSASTPSRSCARWSPDDATLAQFALRWILMHDAVSTVIPGARSPEQARANAAAADAPAARRRDDGGRARGGLRASGSRRTCTSAGSSG